MVNTVSVTCMQKVLVVWKCVNYCNAQHRKQQLLWSAASGESLWSLEPFTTSTLMSVNCQSIGAQEILISLLCSFPQPRPYNNSRYTTQYNFSQVCGYSHRGIWIFLLYWHHNDRLVHFVSPVATSPGQINSAPLSHFLTSWVRDN